MNQLIRETNELLCKGNFNYAICGGFALDLFLKKNVREHSDIDVCVYRKDKLEIINFMKYNGWTVYEFYGNGIVQLVRDISNCQEKRNLMCIKEDCEIVQFYPCEGNLDFFYYKFFYTGIKRLNYIEFLFNDFSLTDFIYERNQSVLRELPKAILYYHNIPYLAPELVLLYKTTDTERQGYQLDFEESIVTMNAEQKEWLKDALDELYPTGHIWGNI